MGSNFPLLLEWVSWITPSGAWSSVSPPRSSPRCKDSVASDLLSLPPEKAGETEIFRKKQTNSYVISVKTKTQPKFLRSSVME